MRRFKVVQMPAGTLEKQLSAYKGSSLYNCDYCETNTDLRWRVSHNYTTSFNTPATHTAHLCSEICATAYILGEI